MDNARKWTTDQEHCFTLRGGQLVVSAGAGSGKTTVLVERIIRLITDENDPVDINRLLVVTFTRLAAAEMRQRIAAALGKLAAKDPGNNRYQRQQMLLPQANITTIDGFCATLLREQTTKAGLPVGFRVAEDTETAPLAEKALDEVLNKAYLAREPGFMGLCDLLNSQKSDRGIRETIQNVYTFLMAQPEPEEWLAAQADNFTRVWAPEDTPWIVPLWEDAAFKIRDTVRLLKDMALACRENGTVPYEGVLESDAQRLGELADAIERRDREAVRSFEDLKYDTLPTAKGLEGDDLSLKETVQSIRGDIKKKVKAVCASLSVTPEELEAQRLQIAPLVGALTELVQDYRKAFTRMKRERRLLDFADLEQEALRLLRDETTHRPTPLAKSLADTYAEVMVDEYQDTNALQDALFSAISREEENLCLVGDVKQSIYAFRQAMPAIFTRRQESAPLYDPDAPAFPATLRLRENFRSRREVTDTVNFLFRRMMHKPLGGVDYQNGQDLVCGARYPDGDGYETEWILSDVPDANTDGLRDREAAIMADRIGGLIESGLPITEKNISRPIAYGDIAILVRTKKAVPAYVKALEAKGIPVSTELSDDILSKPEVSAMLSLLRVIDNPLREVELVAVMLSPLWGFSPDDCANIRLGGKEMSFYSAVTLMAKEDTALGHRCQAMLNDLMRWRTLAAGLPADRLYERLLRESRLEAVFAARSGGSRRVANLHQLDQLLRRFEDDGFRGLSAFVRYIDRIEQNGTAVADGAPTEPTAVRIMTYHKSKGLEFPVVFIPNLNGICDARTSRVQCHADAGLGINVAEEDGGKSFSYLGITTAKKLEECAEEQRLLYVALTRAKEKLILLYSSADLRRDAESLALRGGSEAAILPGAFLEYREPGKMLFMAALRHPAFIHFRPSYIPSLADDRPWVVTDQWQAPAETPQTEAKKADAAASEDTEKRLKELKERAAYRYPYEELAHIPAKLAASALSHQAMQKEHIAGKRPVFLQAEGLSPAQKGTALHTFMQFADYRKAKADLPSEIARLKAAGFLTDRQAEVLPPEKLAAFFAGDLYARMEASPDCRREFPFTLEVPASLIQPAIGEESEETLVVQGIADCFFREGDGLILVDYKTDRVKTPEELVERYRSQMTFYQKALEPILGLPIRQTLLYSFSLGHAVEVK